MHTPECGVVSQAVRKERSALQATRRDRQRHKAYRAAKEDATLALLVVVDALLHLRAC